jgi:signal transduction histidine kinase
MGSPAASIHVCCSRMREIERSSGPPGEPSAERAARQARPLEVLRPELLAGVVTGLAASFATHGDALNMLAMSVGFGLAGWGLGHRRLMRRELGRRMLEIEQHSEALDAVTRTNEERFAELLEAKTAVEEKVEKRTAQLRDTSEKLEETLLQVRALDRAKTDFFNNVSHELRSPLTLILSPLEDLAAGRTPPGGQASAIAAMHRSAARLLQLINQLLDLAKIDAGEMKISAVPTAVPALVRGVLQSFAAAAEAKGVRIELNAPDTIAVLAIDPSWIESACSNLVANALRLTPAGGGIRVSIADSAQAVEIAVADDGPGISDHDQPRVFERFAQGDSTKRNIGGTGIGLALVREAVRLHGGDVTLVSALGQGATFTIRLPRCTQQRSSVPAPSANQQEGASAKPITLPPLAPHPLHDIEEQQVDSHRPGPSSHAPLVFVVEDNPELREFLIEVLASHYRVRSADRGRPALQAIRELRPEIVVSDVAMPEMDGLELCRALRDDPELHSIPLILVTARTDLASILAGFEAGADDYVLKPFHGRELLARVEVHVRLRRMVQEIAMQERHAVLGSLAASVAHQVRNPLTILISGLPAMRARLHGQLSESANSLIDMMIECSERIEQLTRDLMDLSRVDRSLQGDYRPSDGLRAAARLMRAQLTGQIAIDESIEDAPVLRGRPGDMNHVFLNVLDNAVRAIPLGGRIHVSGRIEGDEYVVRVGDSGPGIPKAQRLYVFEPFFTTRPAGEGTGLGLSIARQLVTRCGGAIELGESALGGAEFSVQIPLPERVLLPSNAPEPEAQTSVQQASEPRAEQTQPPSPFGRKAG